MIRAPDVKICNHRRMRHRLRPSLHAQIQMLHGESRWHPWRVAQIAQKSGNIALCLPDKYPRHQRARSGSKHLQHPNPHSQKRSSRTNPAISRPSASPTPRNDPRHPNVPRGVRKTCTTHGFHWSRRCHALALALRSLGHSPDDEEPPLFGTTHLAATRSKPPIPKSCSILKPDWKRAQN